MSLVAKQSEFAGHVAQLIQWLHEQGYQVSFGETWRSPEEARRHGFPNSLHTQRLAVDLNLFKDGRWLSDSEDHRPAGEFWKSLHPENAWGGDFEPKPDGNHYSREHGGVR